MSKPFPFFRNGLALWAGLFSISALCSSTSLDFELSDGRQFVMLSRLPATVTVVNFWRADCPPCVREMPLLAEQARNGGARVMVIALQKQSETLRAPEAVIDSLRPPVVALQGPSEPSGILARFGNKVGALPHTVVLDGMRRVCASRTGEISAEWLAQMVNQCKG